MNFSFYSFFSSLKTLWSNVHFVLDTLVFFSP